MYFLISAPHSLRDWIILLLPITVFLLVLFKLFSWYNNSRREKDKSN
jgi:hypothetical protein